MYVESLELNSFRNYGEEKLFFSQGVNVFLGDNAQGKTNLMESIYFLALARSHRTTVDRELVGWDGDFAKVKGLVQTEKTNYPMEITLTKAGKKAKLNHLEQKKLSNYIGHLNIVLFAPEDLEIVKGSPQVRRRFINMELGQMNAVYLHHLVAYQKNLKQRNQYLKQNKYSSSFDKVYLEILTDQLIEEASHVIKTRHEFTDQLEKWAKPIQREISTSKEDLTICYVSSVENRENLDDIQQELKELYEKNLDRELDQGTTRVGPHRDDLKFYVNEKNVQTYGSQGQQRTTALSVKLAEIELIRDKIGEYPILLLDDVLSELDDERQTHLLKAIENKVQTFITTTSMDGLRLDLLEEPKVFQVSEGSITSEDSDVTEEESG